MSLADAFAPSEAQYRAQVMWVTWGHLAPVAGKVYKGTIVFGEGDYGGIFVLHDRMGVQSSPWWYEDLHEFIGEYVPADAGLRKFTGTYRRTKSGKYQFKGKIEEVTI